MAHAQEETLALRNQVGASSEFYTEALKAASERQMAVQADHDSNNEKLEDAGVAFETLEELVRSGEAEEAFLQEQMDEIQEVLYDHTRRFCDKELPILQAIEQKHNESFGAGIHSRNTEAEDMNTYYTHDEILRVDGAVRHGRTD